MVDSTEAIRVQLQFEADQAEKRAKRMERRLAALENRFDPLNRATKRYNAGLKTLEDNLEAGNIDLARYEKNLESLNREFDAAKSKAAGAGSAVAGMTAPASGLTGVMNRNKTAFQQAGYNIGDFAVQVQGGTSAITAFTQQGSQMLGVFGAYGAIAGAALAVGAPLIASFMNGGEEAEKYADVVDRLREALSSYRDAAELANLSTDDLAERFGTGAEAIRPVIEALAELEKLTALNELNIAAAALSAEFDNLFSNMSPLSELGPMASRTADQLNNAAVGLGLTAGQARELRAALDAVGTATGPDEVSAAARELVALLINIHGSLEAIPSEFQAVARAALEADVEAAELKATLEETVFTVADLVATAHAIDFSNAIAGAQTMLGVLQSAYATAAALAQQRVEYAQQVGRGRGGDPRQFDDGSGTLGDQYGFRQQLADTAYTPPATTTRRRSSSGGGGGGGGVSEEARAAQREMNELQREAERVIEGLLTDVEKYEREMAELSRMHEAGALTTEQFRQAQEDLQQQMMQTQWEDSGLQTFVDELSDAIVNMEDLGDVFANQIKRMASELINSGLTTLMQQAFGGGGGGGFNIGSLFGFGGGGTFGGGKVKSYEGGGFTGMGARSGGIDGRGGFPAILHPNETVIDHTRQSGGGGVNQTFHIDARGAQSGVGAEIEAAIRRAAPMIKKDTLSAVPAFMSEHDRRMR